MLGSHFNSEAVRCEESELIVLSEVCPPCIGEEPVPSAGPGPLKKCVADRLNINCFVSPGIEAVVLVREMCIG